MRWARGGGDQRGEATQEFTARPVNCCYASSGKEGNRMLPEHALYDLRSHQPGAGEAGLAFAGYARRFPALSLEQPAYGVEGPSAPAPGGPARTLVASGPYPTHRVAAYTAFDLYAS